MATARLIAKSLSTSERRARLHDEAGPLAEFCQAMYPLLVAHADDHGRLEGSVFHIKHAIEPTSPRTVTEFKTALLALQTVSLIDWYVVDGKYYVQVVDFKQHQPGLKQDRASKLPGPELAHRMTPQDSVERREVPRSAARTEENLSEGKRTEPKKYSGADAPRSLDENFRVITKIAHEAMKDYPKASSEWPEIVKSECARSKIAYDSAIVQKAIESAIHQQKIRKVS
jgi:hypothetical protein